MKKSLKKELKWQQRFNAKKMKDSGKDVKYTTAQEQFGFVRESHELTGNGAHDDNLIYYTDRDIYDGWCATYNTETGEVVLRDAWFVDRLSFQEKMNLINRIKTQFKK